MNRVANMNPERRLKKLLSDRYANMSEERRAKKKEVRGIMHSCNTLHYQSKKYIMRNYVSFPNRHLSALIDFFFIFCHNFRQVTFNQNVFNTTNINHFSLEILIAILSDYHYIS